MWKGETFIVTHAPRAHVCPTVFLSFTNNLLNGARVVAQIGAVLPEYMFRKGALVTKAALSNVDPVAPVLLGACEQTGPTSSSALCLLYPAYVFLPCILFLPIISSTAHE